MDLKRYKKTRYENIYQNIKNKNFIITISNPKTTISEFNGEKIFDIEIAKKLRNDDKTKMIRANKIANTDIFKTVWDKYMFENEYVLKLEYNTLKKKRIIYNAHYSNYFNNMRITKINDKKIIEFLANLNTTDKQKNFCLRELKTFFHWCIKNKYILLNPCEFIKKYKTTKPEMKYWLPEHLQKILSVLDYDIEKGSIDEKLTAYLIKMLILIGFTLGDRVGETRALRFCDISKEYNIVRIMHSIDYNPNSKTFFKNTKTYNSQRNIVITEKFIEEIEKYENFLEEVFNYTITNKTPILVNMKTNNPYSDTALRKKFNYYINKAKVPKIRMYDLRHTFATTMMSEGWEMYAISDKLGHKNINTTIKTYGHITEQVKKEMASTIDKYY